MCSLEYLSNKSILTDKLRKTQRSLLELQKDYEKALKNEAIEHEKSFKFSDKKHDKELLSNEKKYQNRNDSLLIDLKTMEKNINKFLNTKHERLLDLKEKYAISVKQVQNETKTNDNKESRLHFQPTPSKAPLKIPKADLNAEKIVHNQLTVSDIKDEKDDPPSISPRVRDSRERMHISSEPETSSGKYYNEDHTDYYNLSNAPIPVDQYVKIFLIIHNKMVPDGNYRDIYLNRSKNSHFIEKDSLTRIEHLLKSRTMSTADYSHVPVQDLVEFMLRELANLCSQSNFDFSHLTDSRLMNLIDEKSPLKFDELQTRISQIICQTTEMRMLWEKLVEHFEILIENNFLSKKEIAETFTSSLLPLSSMDPIKNKMSKMIDWFLTKMEERNTDVYVEPSTAQDVTIFSDEESMNISSTTEQRETRKRENALAYNQLRQSLNAVDHSANLNLEDDDPNDDINVLFTTNINKPDNPNSLHSNQSKNRLIKSIQNIDDDFISDDKFHGTTIPKKEFDDDDFDFFK